MNSFSLIAEIISTPELRTTPNNQIPVSNFFVQFPSITGKPEEPPNRLRVSAWGNLATEVKEKFHRGDQVLIEGRLQINTIDRNTYKEKIAELIAQRIYPIGSIPAPSDSFTTTYSPPEIPELPPDEIPF